MGLDLGLDLVPGLLEGGDPGAVYAQLIIAQGAFEVFRLTDMVDTTIIATADSARNGTASGFTLTAPQAIAGPVTGEAGLAPRIDGVNDYGDIQTVSLTAAFNPNVGGVGIWIDRNTDALAREYLFHFQADANNAIWARYEASSAATLSAFRTAGGNSVGWSNLNTGVTPTAWTQIIIGYDTTAGASGEMELFVNDQKVGATITGLTTAAWVGALTVSNLFANAAAGQPFDGNGAYAMLFAGTVPTLAIAQALYAGVSA